MSWRPYPGLPAITALCNGTYTHAPDWYRNFRYIEETRRGLDDTEDLATPGLFRFDLACGTATLIFRPGDGLAVHASRHATRLAGAEQARRTSLGLNRLRAHSFIVDSPRGQTLIAGYPWFTDWGRDSFISLRGLCLATGNINAARAILSSWAGQISQGMLPNRFPDDSGPPEFNSVDASLWFIVAVHACLNAATGDAATDATLIAASLAIIAGYRAGTRHAIRMDPADGLISAGEAGVQLTWMDAICQGRVMTPRIGKPVEIQALWYNALRIGAAWDPSLAGIADLAQASIAAKFPRQQGGLFDVIDADHVPGRTDASIRPNQIFTIGGLPFRALSGNIARTILDEIQTHLLTPIGLRSLAPADPAYHPRYAGPPEQRDAAYHQGTVWPWLITAYVDAWLTQQGNTEAARARAREQFLPALESHRSHIGLGHICEVADGDPPHAPGGCPAQAWSLAEYLRLVVMVGGN